MTWSMRDAGGHVVAEAQAIENPGKLLDARSLPGGGLSR